MTITNDKPVLEPCPFCPDGGNVYFHHSRSCVVCDNCDAEGPWGKTEDDAWRLWNTRAALSQPAQGDANKLSKRIEAAIKRLGDAKAIHSRWYEMPKYEADRYAADNMNEIEQIIYSSICYLEGHKGLYLKPEAQSPAPQPDTGAEIERFPEWLATLDYQRDLSLIWMVAKQSKEYDETIGDRIERVQTLILELKKQVDALAARKGEAQSVDVEALKREILNGHTSEMFEAGVSAALNHLAAAGHLKAQTWLPIETAPKDGTAILVRDYYQHNNERLDDGRLSQTGTDGFGIVVARFDASHGWHVHASVRGGRYILLNNPTHWMPLPPAPAADDWEA